LQAEQAPDGGRGLAARPALQGGAEIDQGDDGDCRLEVGMLGQARHAGGEQRHQHGIDPGRAGAQRDQGVHVGVVVAELAPGAGEEVSAAVDHHRQGQQAGGDPEPPAGGTGQRRQPAGHFRHHQRRGQRAGGDRVADQPPVMGLFGGVAFGFGPGLVAQFGGVVARCPHRADQRVGRRRAGHLGGTVGEIDAGRGDAGHPTQGGLHGGDATGAAHAGDRQAA